MSHKNNDKAYQALLKENAQLMQHNRLLKFELENAQAKIARMEQWTSLRLGKILVESRTAKGLLTLPWKLWRLRKDLKDKSYAQVSKNACPVLEPSSILRRTLVLSTEQMYEELRIADKLGHIISKEYIGDRCVLSGIRPFDHIYINLQSWYEVDGFYGTLSARLEFTGSMDVIGYMYFYDGEAEKIGAIPFYRRKTTVRIPEAAKYFSLALRVRGSGKAVLAGIQIGQQEQEENVAVRLKLSSDKLASQIVIPREGKDSITINKEGNSFALMSTLPQDKHIYLPVKQPIGREMLSTLLYARMNASGTVDISGCITFWGEDKKKLSHAMFFKGKEEVIQVPRDSAAASLFFRVKGSGTAEDMSMYLSTAPSGPAEGKKNEQVQAAAIRHTAVGLSPVAEQCRTVLKDKPETFLSWLKGLRVAVIMDEFTWQSYSPEARMLQLTPEGWHEELEAFKPDMLFVESAWRGKNELWKNIVSKMPPALLGILHWCGDHQVPTAFWNKEDPGHFETFINTAALFDFVFTYDFNCVARYKTVLGHDRVYYLPMAVQTAMFNPEEKFERIDGFCFAGSYYVRYPERTRALEGYIQELPQFKPLDIYDRQYGGTDPNYMFPEKYQPFIKGNLPYDQIDKAYKGYRYSINLSSMNQAQYLARRVYELMACNTLVVSAYSRGVHVQMGDLTILSDSPKEIIRRIKSLEFEPSGVDKLRLAALRKVMSESTYQDRLAYIVAKVCDVRLPDLLPAVYVVARADTGEQAEAVYANYTRQLYTGKHLLLISEAVPRAFHEDKNIRVCSTEEAASVLVELTDHAWVACFASEDFYGANYLTDIMLATRYTKAELIGKAAFYTFAEDKIELKGADSYRGTEQLPARRAAVEASFLKKKALLMLDKDTVLSCENGFSIDRFNYLENGANASVEEAISLCDRENINTGIPVAQMYEYAEKARPLQQDDSNIPSLAKKSLFDEFTAKVPSSFMEVSSTPEGLFHLHSTLPLDKHEYLYGKSFFDLEKIAPHSNTVKLHLETSLGLNLGMVAVFLDKKKQKLQNVHFKANTNVEIPVCDGAAFVRFAMRVSGSGTVDVKKLLFGHHNLEFERILGVEETLVLTNNYPSYDNLYKNAFVHSRVRAYHREGVPVSVYQFQSGQNLYFDEFEGIDVFRGGESALRKILAQGKVRRILVHFLDAGMWEVLKDVPSNVRIIVWLHGSEIQPWTRRVCNYTSQIELEKAKRQSDIRMTFWNKIFNILPDNIHFVFVSQYLADEVMEDNHITLSKDKYSIIHNPIDTTIFRYHEKDEEQRYKLLSIRPFGSRNYANDLTVKCILKLTKRKDFNKFSITIVGNGSMFDELVEPLRHMPNVKLEKTFLTHAEIVSLHHVHGVFIVPTRIDTQGVSRDEAMASGLVPITNAVTAIPEFVDDTCGILAPAEDAEAMAAGISRLVDNPDLFLAMSKAAAERVRRQTAANIIVNQELKLILGEERR